MERNRKEESLKQQREEYTDGFQRLRLPTHYYQRALQTLCGGDDDGTPITPDGENVMGSICRLLIMLALKEGRYVDDEQIDAIVEDARAHENDQKSENPGTPDEMEYWGGEQFHFAQDFNHSPYGVVTLIAEAVHGKRHGESGYTLEEKREILQRYLVGGLDIVIEEGIIVENEEREFYWSEDGLDNFRRLMKTYGVDQA